MTSLRRLLVVLAATSALVLAGCSGDDGSDESDPTTETSADDGSADDAGSDGGDESDEALGIDYAERGPYEVGTTLLEIDGVEVYVFYPADDEGTDEGEHITSISSTVAFPDEFTDLVPDFFIQELAVDVYLDVPISEEGPFGVVLHSHGASGFPLYATNHLSHTASWGYVVAAPSHPTRNLASAVGPPTSTEASDVDDLMATLDRLEADNADPDSIFYTALDTETVGAEGHSAGGRAVLQLASADDRVRTVIGQAPAPPVSFELLRGDADTEEGPESDEDASTDNGAGADGEAADTDDAGTEGDEPGQADVERSAALDAALAELTPPSVSVLLMPGERDGVIPLSSIESLYSWLEAPKAMVVLANAGHNPFLDICANIRSQGGLVANAGDLADLFGPLLALGEDGCVDGYLEPDDGFALSRHLTVAWYRWAFGQDDTTDSIDAAFLEATFPDATGEVSEDLG